MLLHPPIIILIFALTIGAGSFAYLLQLHERYKKKYLRFYFFFTFFFNLALSIRLLQYYFTKNVLSENSPSNFWIMVFPTENLLFYCFVFQTIMAYFLISKIQNAKIYQTKKPLILIYSTISLTFFVSLFITVILQNHLLFFKIIPLFYAFCTLLFFYLILKTKTLTDKSSNQSEPLGKFFIIYFSIQFCLATLIRFFLSIKAFCDTPFFLLPLPIFYLLSNIAIFVISITVLKKSQAVTSRNTLNSDFLNTFIFEYKLSKREHEVLKFVCEGKKNREISDLLFVTLNTVKFHMSNIYKKVKVENRVQLINKIFHQ